MIILFSYILGYIVNYFVLKIVLKRVVNRDYICKYSKKDRVANLFMSIGSWITLIISTTIILSNYWDDLDDSEEAKW